MSLSQLVDNKRTDKNTRHSYLETYESLLSCKKETARNVLEVGIYKGGSIKLWKDYFTNAIVYGLDILKIEDVWEGIKNDDRINLYTSTNAYDKKFIENTFLDKNIKFDFLIDDGPHTLDSMKKFIALYSPLMTEDGILIIEDVQDFDWFEQLKDETPEHLKPFIQTFDLRKNKNRYDDLVFVIDKSKK